MRKIFSFILVVLFTVSVSAQTVSLTAHAVNPRQVAADAGDIFDLTSNGLTKIGRASCKERV